MVHQKTKHMKLRDVIAILTLFLFLMEVIYCVGVFQNFNILTTHLVEDFKQKNSLSL